LTRVEDRNTADMAAQFTQIASIADFFFVEIVLSTPTAGPCVKTIRPLASSANLFTPDLSGRLKRKLLKPKQLFVQFNMILPGSGARREEEIQFSLFVYFCLSFFG